VIQALALALLVFFPHIEKPRAEYYAAAIMEESYHAGVDPLLVASRAWVESGFSPAALHAGTYGMMQTRRRLVTVREQVREGARALAYWRQWHARGKCLQNPPHPSWRHYTFGYIVPRWARVPVSWKMDRVYHLLEREIYRHGPPRRTRSNI
jgi:hypothetical protein